jgi:hypothetical protein
MATRLIERLIETAVNFIDTPVGQKRLRRMIIIVVRLPMADNPIQIKE